MRDLISRQAAIDAIYEICNEPVAWLIRAAREIENLPPAQHEITDEQAIEHLQSTGWMQSHDRILTQSTWDIIRCQDCRWQKDQSGSTAWLPCMALVTPSDFYCGRAERRSDAL